MIRTAKRQTLHIWIAILAILFSALAPTISHALAARTDSAVTLEICTVNGYKVVKVTDSESSKKPATAKHGMEQCAFCVTHGGTFALTGSSSLVFAIDSVREIYPPLFYAAPHSLHAWSTANPRAPPFLA
ncbi:DUF2946 domain-containing protein [Duganella sp. FT135W]|uniref:DUF2946 domain-containing protein n=1 Tax=Duganella flavida TaxID=2692175 RepID=A0A6L8K8I9_9BURK|nr:DUF2946 domain-containing protein [Duganella flavida]MYM22174.1 DUF2946 domain-containing protein [Duganella flavida]